jgi:hypothetical protein
MPIVNGKQLPKFTRPALEIGAQTLRVLKYEVSLVSFEWLCKKVEVLDPRGHVIIVNASV